jgi:hypothetical protein
MKKKLIAAGAASLAVAAMPVVGVFAAAGTNPSVHTDLLNITIDNVCSFGYTSGSAINVTGVAHTPTTEGVWTSSADPETGVKTDTLRVTMVNGTANGNIGTTTLGIYCNNHAGYKVTSAFTDGAGEVVTGTGAGNLVGQTTSETIAPGLTESENVISTADSGWAYKVADATGHSSNIADVLSTYGSWSAGVGDIISSANASGSKMTTNAGDYFTVTYGAAIDEAQAADTYKGGIQYTLSQL